MEDGAGAVVEDDWSGSPVTGPPTIHQPQGLSSPTVYKMTGRTYMCGSPYPYTFITNHPRRLDLLRPEVMTVPPTLTNIKELGFGIAQNALPDRARKVLQNVRDKVCLMWDTFQWNQVKQTQTPNAPRRYMSATFTGRKTHPCWAPGDRNTLHEALLQATEDWRGLVKGYPQALAILARHTGDQMPHREIAPTIEAIPPPSCDLTVWY